MSDDECTSFKDELEIVVNEVRNFVKTNATEVFIDILRREMYDQAEEGLRDGCFLIDDLFSALSKRADMDRLKKILNKDRSELLQWLLGQAYNSRIFRGIDLETDEEETYVTFSWGE